MKKIISTFVALILIFSVVTVSADVPEALSKAYTNYTCDYSLSLSFESSDELVALLEELGMPEEINNYIDVKSLLKSILTNKTKMNIQLDMSEDFKRVEMGLTADSVQPIDVNRNLSLDIKSKLGMWMKMDLTASQPVFELIYSHPFLNKYMVIDVLDIANYEEAKSELLSFLNSVFNKEYVKSVTDYSTELLEKYADIKVSGGNCTITIDNDGFTAMMDDIIKYVYDMVNEDMEVSTIPDVYASMIPYEEIPSFKGMKILGDEGMTINCKMVFGNITLAVVDADFAINIEDIYTSITGEEWLYESEGVLKFNVHEEAEVTNIGKTKVDFPELTEENSFDFMDMMYDEDDGHGEDYEEYEPEYPHYFVSGYTDYLPVIEDEIYVPLRTTMEDAYYDTVNIAYDNGVITMTSEYFETIVLTVGSDKVSIGGAIHNTDKVLKFENTTYVSAGFFEEIFGWQLSSATYKMLDKEYYYSFYTIQY